MIVLSLPPGPRLSTVVSAKIHHCCIKYVQENVYLKKHIQYNKNLNFRIRIFFYPGGGSNDQTSTTTILEWMVARGTGSITECVGRGKGHCQLKTGHWQENLKRSHGSQRQWA